MAQAEIAGVTVNVNEEGYMIDPSQWNREIARKLADDLEIFELTEAHWKVIEFLRKDFEEKGTVPAVRRIDKVGGTPTRELYKLFPKGPVKKAAKIAGLQKPESCV
jgi:tRNA 2-thiouridine synthesizing protein E